MKKSLVLIILVFAFLVINLKELWSAEFPVSTVAQLESALLAAEANGQDDVIKVAQGTYIGSFAFSSDEEYSITLLGGYSSDFSDRVIDPSNTVLDANGLGRVLRIYSEGAGGNIKIEGFTIQNGNAGLEDNGGGIYAFSDVDYGPSGNIIIANNIITGNEAGYDGGGVLAWSLTVNGGSSGDISFECNTITGNSAGSSGAGAEVRNWAQGWDSVYQAGNIYFASNTITGNSADFHSAVNIVTIGFGDNMGGHTEFVNNLIAGNDNGGVWVDMEGEGDCATFTNNTIADNTDHGLHINSWSSGTANVYNNIIWNNWNSYYEEFLDIIIYLFPQGTGVRNGFNNDYLVMYIDEDQGYYDWDNALNNIHQDPLFHGGGDYHLQPASPCIDSGDDSLYLLPTEDIEGNPRIFDGDSDGSDVVDMGAFEYLIPEEQIENLIEDIDDLLETGELNSGQASSLNIKLDMVQNRIDSGNFRAACNLLRAFINEVNSYIDEGVLTPEVGQALIDAANRLRDELCG